jgi:hypothetical protein
VEKISEFVINVGHSIHLRNGPACKNKWGSFFTSGAPCLETSKKSMIVSQLPGTMKNIDFTMNTHSNTFFVMCRLFGNFLSSLLSLQPCVIDVVDSK